jgi:hypothetical protein
MQQQTFRAKRGDVLVWLAWLVPPLAFADLTTEDPEKRGDPLLPTRRGA